ncbi:MAG: capsule assembly Wzi family protein [Bacteroidota bacterium]
MSFQKAIIPFLVFSISFVNIVLCQRENSFQTEANAILGTETTPFWMRANKFGKVPTKGQTLALFAGAQSDYQNDESKIDWGYGLNIGGFVGMQNKFIVQQAYAKAKWRAFELYAGRREEIQGLVDTTLSSGSYIWSGNALPLPKIQISIPNYTPIGASGLFSLKGNYAHGWFNRDRDDAKGVMLHQKSLYFRIGKPNYKLKLYAGLNHQAQWGGKILFPDPKGNYSENGRFGSSLSDYFYIVTGRSAVGEDSTRFAGANEVLNRVGNHLGSLDFAIELNGSKTKILIYRQSVFDDGSLFYLNNITDGLNGISVSFKNSLNQNIKINKIVFEFLNTLNQGGPFNGDNPLSTSTRGLDNYFNNTQFRDGWSFNKTSIGTPFLLTKYEYPNSTSKKFDLIFSNNKVQSYYFGMNGAILNEYNFESRFSFSKNWGSIGTPLRGIYQSSFLVNVNKDLGSILGGINGNVTLAGDFGDLLESNFAIQFGIKKSINTLPFLHPTHRH